MMQFIMPAMQIASSVAGAAASGKGAQQQGSAAEQTGEINAMIFEKQATIARQRAAVQAQRTRKEGIQIGSRIVRAFGSSGVDANEGSALDVMGEHAAEYEWRALSDEWQGEAEGASLQYKAALSRYQGKVAAAGHYAKGVGSMLGGAAGAIMGGAGLFDVLKGKGGDGGGNSVPFLPTTGATAPGFPGIL